MEVPEYRWVVGPTTGCEGCCFRKMLEVRCSLVPCQKHLGMVAQLVEGKDENVQRDNNLASSADSR